MRKVLILVTCIVVLLCIPLIPVAENSEDAFVTKDNRSQISQMGPVVITSNAQMLSAGFDGSGTVEDPYRIYSFYIPTDGQYGIWVSNVNYYFRIWDCLITDSPYMGIGIRNCLNVNISESTVQGAEYGISIVDTTTAFVEDCHITPEDEGIGILLDDVLLASISGCTIIGGETGSSVLSSTVYYDSNSFIDCNNGILGAPASNCIISSNTFENCTGYGIRLEDYSNTISMLGNTFTGFYTGGILLRYTQSMSILGNNFTHCGLTVIGSSNFHYEHVVEGNLVNTKPLLYLYDVSNAHYSGDDYGQIYLISCEDITLSGGLITSTQRGVYIAYSTECTVQDMMITACQSGITIDESEFVTVQNCTIRSCSIGLILFSGANYNSFLGNQISYSFLEGVYLNPSTSLNLLVNNTFHHNDDGLLDSGIQNYWDDGEEFGNYYDDYNGYGNYSIPGSANSVDNYPGRYVPTSSSGIVPPFEVTLFLGLGISVTGVILVLYLLKRVWGSKGF